MKPSEVTKPGYYWYENQYGGWRVVEISRVLGDFYVTISGREDENLLTDMRGEFLGPIKPIGHPDKYGESQP